ncbi:MAG: hypothetical protein PHQ86_09010 [Dehalococcoidales bacterium]|nr:hypothetical protein [Dehalococcoidales bacterium]
MTKAEKREIKIRQNPDNVSLEDFEFLINQYGEIIEGSNHPKAHIHNHVYPYKRKNPVSAHYVEGILRIIDEMKGE